MNIELFNNQITPACKYCKHASLAADKIHLHCKHSKDISPEYSCKKFVYSPLMRVPLKQSELPQFNEDDFSIK